MSRTLKPAELYIENHWLEYPNGIPIESWGRDEQVVRFTDAGWAYVHNLRRQQAERGVGVVSVLGDDAVAVHPFRGQEEGQTMSAKARGRVCIRRVLQGKSPCSDDGRAPHRDVLGAGAVSVAVSVLGEVGTVYLLCYDYTNPLTGHARPLHYYGWAKKGDGSTRIRRHMAGTSGAKLPAAMHARGVVVHVGRIWRNATRHDERALKRGRNATRRCLRCRRARAGARVGETLEELLARSVEMAAAQRARRNR